LTTILEFVTADQQSHSIKPDWFGQSKVFRRWRKDVVEEKKPVFVHASIRTSNMEKSIDFYSKFLGLKVTVRREIPQNNAEIAFLQDGEAKGALLELTWYRSQKKFVQAEYEDRLFDHLAFEVKDMNKTIDDMRKASVTITDEPFKLNSSGSLIAFVEDPDGTLIELIERPKPHPSP
jgi:lactoylglutathione lyase